MKLFELMNALRALEPEHGGDVDVKIGDEGVAFHIGRVYFVEQEDGAMHRFIAIEPNRK